MNVLERLKTSLVIAVIRAESKEKAKLLVEACVAGGISAIEVTYTVNEAGLLINELVKEYEGKDLLIGAGTVLDEKTALDAINNGASFVVSPAYDKDVNELCNSKNITYIPGCITPTEIVNAMNGGVKLFKIFPGSIVGPKYIKTLKGPFPNLDFMPTGGVSLDNVSEWIKNGSVCVGIGGELTNPGKSGDYKEVERLAKEFLNKAKGN